jgi:hypothetical protein
MNDTTQNTMNAVRELCPGALVNEFTARDGSLWIKATFTARNDRNVQDAVKTVNSKRAEAVSAIRAIGLECKAIRYSRKGAMVEISASGAEWSSVAPYNLATSGVWVKL